MIKGWKKLNQSQIKHLSEAHMNYEAQWQQNLRYQKYWAVTYGIQRCCRDCIGIAQTLGQWNSLVVPDDIKGARH